jgi:hypothetical protein
LQGAERREQTLLAKRLLQEGHPKLSTSASTPSPSMKPEHTKIRPLALRSRKRRITAEESPSGSFASAINRSKLAPSITASASALLVLGVTLKPSRSRMRSRTLRIDGRSNWSN